MLKNLSKFILFCVAAAGIAAALYYFMNRRDFDYDMDFDDDFDDFDSFDEGESSRSYVSLDSENDDSEFTSDDDVAMSAS